jgi:ABC-type Fe3+ transport system substrate-binding protein
MPTRAYQSSREGVEVKVAYPTEGVVLLGDPWAILARAPHPNAAKLWIDFVFSKEGHSLYLQHEGLMSARDDMEVPPALARFSPSIRTVKSIPVDWKALGDADRNRAREEFREIFGR